MNNWLSEFTEREAKEIAFATAYATSFNHGTDGHSRLILIAKLVTQLDKQEAEIKNARSAHA